MTRLAVAALIVFCVLTTFTTSAVAVEFALTQRSDEEIVEHCNELLERLENVPAEEKTSLKLMSEGDVLEDSRLRSGPRSRYRMRFNIRAG